MKKFTLFKKTDEFGNFWYLHKHNDEFEEWAIGKERIFDDGSHFGDWWKFVDSKNDVLIKLFWNDNILPAGILVFYSRKT